MASNIKNGNLWNYLKFRKFHHLTIYLLVFSVLCTLFISIAIYAYFEARGVWFRNRSFGKEAIAILFATIACGFGFGMVAQRLPVRIMMLADLLIASIFLLACIFVHDVIPAGASAFYVGGDVTGLFSNTETYFLVVLAWFGLMVNMALMGDEHTGEWGRKIVGGLLVLIGILLPGFIESYGLLWACKGSDKCYRTRETIIDSEILFRDLSISFASALALTFFASFLISRGASWAQNYFSYVDSLLKSASSSDLPAASGDKDLPAETASESMSPANVQELVTSPGKQPAAGKTSTLQCLTAAAVLSVVAVVGASFGRWTVRRR